MGYTYNIYIYYIYTIYNSRASLLGSIAPTFSSHGEWIQKDECVIRHAETKLKTWWICLKSWDWPWPLNGNILYKLWDRMVYLVIYCIYTIYNIDIIYNI